MRVAFGIVIVLLILALVYFFLPQGMKKTISAVFTGSNTSQNKAASPSPSASSLASSRTPGPAASPTAVSSASGSLRSASPTASSSATSKTATQSGTIAKLPGTGIQNQSPEVTVIQVLLSALILLVGVRLSKHI